MSVAPANIVKDRACSKTLAIKKLSIPLSPSLESQLVWVAEYPCRRRELYREKQMAR